MPAEASATRALLTGGRGFVGRRLAAVLRERHPDWRIEAPDRTPTAGEPEVLDVTDAAAVEAWVRDRRPDVAVHLAAVAAVTAATRDPRHAWRVNLDGTLNLVLALQTHAPDAHLVFISSAEVYGRSLDSSEPVTEAALLQPVNPYAASKAAADILVRQAAIAGLSSSVLRAFNHTGPGQAEDFVAPSFAGQVARIEAGLQPPVLKTGDLDDERDFLDLDDVVDAYAAVIDARGRLQPGEVFNVASGRAVRIGDIVEALLSRARVPITVERDPARMRRTTVRRIVGDASHLTARTGWRPRRALDDTLARMLEHARAQVTGR